MQSVPLQTETAPSAAQTHASTSSVTTTNALLDTETDQILQNLVSFHCDLKKILIKVQGKVDIYQMQVTVFKIYFMKKELGHILIKSTFCLFIFSIL